ncbi:uroporphyrinogen-III C-methyltransferase [Christiangramia flava]|uniref:uroporphyrinogen-III C-methyltransferase n=1 Tax=Christiangramia flava JLT2011 TaxID=1229726 RepID=A0A1L7I6U7_9FLAO|nr:uroporphyrinogen-III C-methyltransferase [Christiangramia flava]APU68832.1 Uroporphyrinogen-III methyltransferase [Christiangramia flava JLT2011]OSS39023.1 Uroporphyrinogen-III methyltransferase [Christiangramia flava JLT2011]
MYNQPKLSVVGAGPGDPELITIKAVRALESANVVLYDALINRELLEYAPQAEHIFVGKRKDRHRYSQDEINELIVKYALERGHVVRLKGGDPFIFGRGSEEINYARKHRLETEVVSGITSSIAVPANVGIPLTQRGTSESFWVITGTTSSKKLSEDVKLAAQSTATVAILMGMGKLEEIVEVFKSFGKKDIPVGIIQNGTTVNERSGFGTIDTIVDVVSDKKLTSPAIIVIGEVVKEANALQEVFQNVQNIPQQSKLINAGAA